MKLILLIIFSAFFFSCGQELKETSSDLFLSRGDLIITSNTADDAISLNSDTLESKQLTSLDRSSERVSSTGWMSSTEELLMAIDGRDRVVALSPIDGSRRDVVVNTQLNGNLRCVAQLTNGDILVCESNNVERFNSQGVRITAGWPIGINTVFGIIPIAGGSFVACGGGSTDQVRIYDNDGNILASDAGPGGHDARACNVLSDGRIVVNYSGGADQVWIYNSDLTGGQAIVLNSDLTLIPTPTGVAELANGNIAIADSSFHHIVEVTTTGEFVRKYGFLHDPLNLFIIPSN